MVTLSTSFISQEAEYITTTILPTTTTTTASTTTTTTTTDAATTTESTSTTSETATSESSSAVSTVDIVTEAATPVSVGSSNSSTDVPATEPKTDDSKIHFRDDGPVRDFTKRIFVDDGLVDARRKAIEARRKAASD